MSEGELINSRTAIDNRNIFTQGIGGFSSKSINELFDVDNDGIVSAVEKDLMSSAGALNTLESISPIVAYAFSQENFRIATGSYLTNSQKVMRDKLVLAFNKAMLIEKLNEIPERKEEEKLNIDNGELDTKDLLQDIARRQFLSGAEIDNGV
jgi:hypothetical protein